MGYWRSFYHLIWGTKLREPLIDEDRERLLQQSIRASCEKQKAIVHAVGIMPDHVHLAASVPPTIAITDFVRLVKGSSSHLLNQRSKRSRFETFSWQAEFGMLTFGERSLKEVRDYIDNQRTHHAEGTLLPSFEQLEPLIPRNGSHS